VANSKINPWIRGVVDTLVGASIINNSTIPTKNRLIVILIDTAFETSCRAFLKYKARIKLDQNHSHRDPLVKTVRSKLPEIDALVWEKIEYYYTEIRSDFYHQSAGKTLPDDDLLDYQEAVEFVIDRAFNIRVADLVRAEMEAIQQTIAPVVTQETNKSTPINDSLDNKDKILIAVSQVFPDSVDQVNEFFRKQGLNLRLKGEEFTNIVARNSGTKKLFFFNKELRRWEPSALGKFRLATVVKGESDEQ
jgi:hypothetical protein